MATIPKRVIDRIQKTVPNFVKILEQAKLRDVNESDTVTIITDLLADIHGYDKYTEVTSEQAIRGTYCDLAVKLDGEIKFLIEVKAIGLSLKDNHLRQAIGYGAAEGIPWVVLTNGIEWSIYRIKFEKPLSHELICSWSFESINAKKSEDIEKLFLLCKEGHVKDKSAIEEFHEYAQVINKYTIGAIIQTESVVSVIKRELKKISPNSKVTSEEIISLLIDTLKRDVLEGEHADDAVKMVKRAMQKQLRKKAQKSNPEPVTTNENIVDNGIENQGHTNNDV